MIKYIEPEYRKHRNNDARSGSLKCRIMIEAKIDIILCLASVILNGCSVCMIYLKCRTMIV